MVIMGCRNPEHSVCEINKTKKTPTLSVGGLVEYIEYTTLFYVIVSNLQPLNLYFAVFSCPSQSYRGGNITKKGSLKMKNIMIISVIGIMLTGGGNAVQKCVAIDTSEPINCTTSASAIYETYWEGSCIFGTRSTYTGLFVTGESMCSSSRNLTSSGALDLYTTHPSYSDLTYSADALNDSRQCWCRMLTPAISKWIYINQHSGALDCHKNCSTLCSDKMDGTYDFQMAIFSNLISGD